MNIITKAILATMISCFFGSTVASAETQGIIRTNPAATQGSIVIDKANWKVTFCKNDGFICADNLSGPFGFKNDLLATDIAAIYVVGNDFGWQKTSEGSTGISPISKVSNGTTIFNLYSTPANVNGVTIAVVTNTNEAFFVNPEKWVLKEKKAGLFGKKTPQWLGERIYYGEYKSPRVTMEKIKGIETIVISSDSGYLPTQGKYGSIRTPSVTKSCYNSLFFPMTMDPFVCSKNGAKSLVKTDAYPYKISFPGIISTNDEANPVFEAYKEVMALNLDRISVGKGLHLVQKVTTDGGRYKVIQIGNPNQLPEIRFDSASGSIILAANNPGMTDIWPNKGTPAYFGIISERNTWVGKKADITLDENGDMIATLTKDMIADNENNANLFVEYADGARSYFGNTWALVNMTKNQNGSFNYGEYMQSEASYDKNTHNLTIMFNANKIVGFGEFVAVTEKICLRGNNPTPDWTGCPIGATPTIGADGRLTVTLPYPADADPGQIFTLAVERGDPSNPSDDLWMSIGKTNEAYYWLNPAYSSITKDLEVILNENNYYLHVKQ